jgi:hypothetical protein
LHSPADYLGAVPVDLAQPLVPRRRNLAPIVVVDGLNGRACYEAVIVFVGCSIPAQYTKILVTLARWGRTCVTHSRAFRWIFVIMHIMHVFVVREPVRSSYSYPPRPARSRGRGLVPLRGPYVISLREQILKIPRCPPHRFSGRLLSNASMSRLGRS